MTRGAGSTEQRLREALDVLAAGVHAAPDAYEQVRAQWRRRERRRRILLAVLVAIVFALADLIGLWALNHVRDGAGGSVYRPEQVDERDRGSPSGESGSGP